jgi:medium-chain acyl-[acyl-carrier-protein] hydrolase
VLGGTPEELLHEPDPMWLRLLRADFELNEAYRQETRKPLSIPLSAFGGRDDPRVSPPDLQAWSVQTHSSFALRLFDGGHFFLHTGRAAVVQSLLLALTRSTGPS